MGKTKKYIYKDVFKEGVSVFSLLTGCFQKVFRVLGQNEQKPTPPYENPKYIYIYFCHAFVDVLTIK